MPHKKKPRRRFGERVFGGKKFIRRATTSDKRAAKTFAKSVRERGEQARVVRRKASNIDEFDVFVRRS